MSDIAKYKPFITRFAQTKGGLWSIAIVKDPKSDHGDIKEFKHGHLQGSKSNYPERLLDGMFDRIISDSKTFDGIVYIEQPVSKAVHGAKSSALKKKIQELSRKYKLAPEKVANLLDEAREVQKEMSTSSVTLASLKSRIYKLESILSATAKKCEYADSQGRCKISVPEINIKRLGACPWYPSEWTESQDDCPKYESI